MLSIYGNCLQRKVVNLEDLYEDDFKDDQSDEDEDSSCTPCQQMSIMEHPLSKLSHSNPSSETPVHSEKILSASSNCTRYTISYNNFAI